MKKKEPLYISILEVIKERIIQGEYAIGSLLPTETDFENEFDVSKITVRKAIELLEIEGYVLKQSGKGTTVISNSIFNKLSKGDSFSSILQKEGMNLHKQKTVIETVKLTSDDALFQYFKNKCIRIKRLYYLDGKPYIYFTHYLPGNIKLDHIEDDNAFSIYMQLYKNKQFISNFHDEFYIEEPDAHILKALELEHGPLLGRKRITYNEDDEVIEVSFAQYNTKMHHYVINYRV